MIRIMVVDDHPLIRIGVKMVLMQKADRYQVMAEADCADAMFRQLGEGVTPDLVMLDILMPGMSGVEAARKLREQYPGIAILVMTSETNPQTFADLAAIDVEGIISKNYTDQELTDAIDCVMDGLTYYGRDVCKIIRDVRAFRNDIPDETFSERELEIIRCCRDGMTAKQIGDKLCISPRTVSNHKQNIFSKMGINSNYEMVTFALEHGFISRI